MRLKSRKTWVDGLVDALILAGALWMIAQADTSTDVGGVIIGAILAMLAWDGLKE